MPPPGPTLAEVVRRLDDVVTRLDRLYTQLEETYVRKDVLEAKEAADTIHMQGLEEEQRAMARRLDQTDEATATNHRLIITSFVAPVVVAVVLALVLSAIGVHR